MGAPARLFRLADSLAGCLAGWQASRPKILIPVSIMDDFTLRHRGAHPTSADCRPDQARILRPPDSLIGRCRSILSQVSLLVVDLTAGSGAAREAAV